MSVVKKDSKGFILTEKQMRMGDPPDAPPLDPDFGSWDERDLRREAEEENAEQRQERELEERAPGQDTKED